MSGIAFFPGKKGQWKAPKTKKERAKLMVWNSLTRSKVWARMQTDGLIGTHRMSLCRKIAAELPGIAVAPRFMTGVIWDMQGKMRGAWAQANG